MIVFNLTIIIAPEYLDYQIAAERSYQGRKAVHDAAQARQQAEDDARRAAWESSSHLIQCECGWEGRYATPGRARMGLSGHKRRCQREGEGA